LFRVILISPVITHMCSLQNVLWRTGLDGYRWQITMAKLSERGRSWM